jgi:anti-anti-sigma factor
VNELTRGPFDVTTGLIQVKSEPDGHVLYLSGDVDAPVVRQLEREHDLAALDVVAVDVGGLTFIDSTGLSMLVKWAVQATGAGRPAQIRHATDLFERVIALAGLTHLFTRT